jgi:hypothetical protein
MLLNSDNLAIPNSSLLYLNEINAIKRDHLTDKEFELLFQKLKLDLVNKNQEHNLELLDALYSMIPVQDLPVFFNRILQEFESHRIELCHIINSLLITQRPVYQMYALNIIEYLNEPIFVPAVVSLALESHIPLRQKAFNTLRKVDGQTQLILEGYLKDRCKPKRELAAKILKEIAPQNQKLALYNLTNPDFIERANALNILGKTGDKKFLPKIEECLEDGDIAVKKAAIDAIGQIGGKKAVEILRGQLGLQDHEPLCNIIRDYIFSK